ncbi:MAG: hypothetical protein AABZ84_02465 [Pseudomonadota bacterium]
MTVETVWVAAGTYLVMLAAFYLSRYRWLHIPIMVSVMLFDLAMPFYLYLTGDWYRRLIEHEEIFSFLIWMHVGLVFTLYALYFLQIQSARKIFRGDGEGRADHYSQAKAILLVRGLVLLTAALLVEPESTP